MPRLFFALIPKNEESAALALTAAQRFAQFGGQAIPPDNFHVTLGFLGEVPEESTDALRKVAAGIRARAMLLRFECFDYWPKPGIVCAVEALTVISPAAPLAQQLHDALVAAGFAPDIKPFRAHVTLARKITAAAASTQLWPQEFSPPFVLRCDRFALMSSRREEGRSIYSVVDSWLLDEDFTR